MEITLKKIIEDLTFTHKDTYELGAKLLGNAKETIARINTIPDFERILKQTEYHLIETRKKELEIELKDLSK